MRKLGWVIVAGGLLIGCSPRPCGLAGMPPCGASVVNRENSGISQDAALLYLQNRAYMQQQQMDQNARTLQEGLAAAGRTSSSYQQRPLWMGMTCRHDGEYTYCN